MAHDAERLTLVVTERPHAHTPGISRADSSSKHLKVEFMYRLGWQTVLAVSTRTVSCVCRLTVLRTGVCLVLRIKSARFLMHGHRLPW